MSPRSEFLQRTTQVLARCHVDRQLLAVLIVRVRRMREINLSFGYEIGDQLLQAMQARAATILRPQDEAYRISSNEFGLLLPGIRNTGHAVLAANKMVRELERIFTINDLEVGASVSIGIAVAPLHAGHAEALLQSADVAATHAKAHHEKFFVFNQEVGAGVTPLMALEQALHDALGNDEFELYYQPQVDLRRHTVSGIEALLRWKSSGELNLGPDVFIPVAEQSELIEYITKWTLDTAIQFCVQRDMGNKLAVAVNLSPVLFDKPNIRELVTGTLKFWNIEPHNLIVEITEGAVMKDIASSRNLIQELHDSGVRVSIDDFGTGYSSLAYLNKLPVQELKIDRSFVKNMVADANDAKIVKAIINLAHDFDMEVVAEGVEDAQTLERLAALGCDFAQGYYIGRPMTQQHFCEWLKGSDWKAA